MFQTNLMVYYPQWGGLYPPDLILHGEQIKIRVNYITELIILLLDQGRQQWYGQYGHDRFLREKKWGRMDLTYACVIE